MNKRELEPLTVLIAGMASNMCAGILSDLDQCLSPQVLADMCVVQAEAILETMRNQGYKVWTEDTNS